MRINNIGRDIARSSKSSKKNFSGTNFLIKNQDISGALVNESRHSRQAESKKRRNFWPNSESHSIQDQVHGRVSDQIHNWIYQRVHARIRQSPNFLEWEEWEDVAFDRRQKRRHWPILARKTAMNRKGRRNSSTGGSWLPICWPDWKLSKNFCLTIKIIKKGKVIGATKMDSSTEFQKN